MTDSKHDTLSRRLGGRDAIARIVVNWFERMKHDPEIRLFHELGADMEGESVQAMIAFLNAASRGCGHFSRSQQQVAHMDIVLLSNQWEVSAGHLMDALARDGVSDRVKGEVMSCMAGLREEIADQWGR